jgi:phosphate transport system permease protein
MATEAASLRAKHATPIAVRRIRSLLGEIFAGTCAGVAAILLLTIFVYVLREGVGALNLDFVTQLPRPVGITGGGVSNGILGSLIIIGIAVVIATPVGVLTGIYLALFGSGTLAESVRFMADVLSGVPSIAIGLFAYTLLVAPFHHFSGLSASFAFAILMLPLIIRTSEEAVRTVPRRTREGGFALGLSKYATTMRVVLPAARPAILTGVLLGIARVTGETAPLLFTAFGTQFMELNPTNPMAELALQVFTYAISPYQDWHRQAWAGAALLILAVFVLNVAARFLLKPRSTKRI